MATFDQDGVTYLLRDKFTSDESPLADGSASEGAGVGYRDVTGTSFYADDGRLRGGNNSSEGKIVYQPDSSTSGWDRVGGRTFTALMTTDDGDGDMRLYLAETAGSLDGYGITFTNGTWNIVEPDGNTVTAVNVDNEPMKAVPYLVGITLNADRGAVYWISALTEYDPGTDWTIPAYPSARIIWVSTLGTFATVHPTLRASSTFTYPGGVIVEDVRLFDITDWSGADGMALFADRFDRADSNTTMGADWTAEASTTWGIISDQAYNVASAFNGRVYADAGESDVWVVADITSGSNISDGFGLLIRRVDASNWIRLHNDGSTNIKFQSWIAGGFGDNFLQGSAGFTTSTTYRFLVGCRGNEYRIFINGDGTVLGPSTESSGTFVDATQYGLFGNSTSGQRWDNFAVYPISFALTAEFASGAIPAQPVVSETIAVDTFTGSNGTALTTHNAAWSTDGGTWTIESNRAQGAGASGQLHAYLNAGRADVQASVEVVMPASVTLVRAGLVLRRADANNYVRVRCYVDDGSQLNNDEIEVQEVIGGSAAVVHKCYLGNHFASNTAYTLTAQIFRDELLVYLDGIAQLQVILSSAALLTGTGVGLYREGGSDNVTFDDFAVVRADGLPIPGHAVISESAFGALVQEVRLT